MNVKRNKKDIVLFNESGAVLMVTMLVMVLLMLISGSAIQRANTDMQIVNNFKYSENSIYAADAGTEVASNTIKESLSNSVVPTIPSMTLNDSVLYTELTSDLYNDIDSSNPNSASPAPDITYIINNQTNSIDIDLTARAACPGASSGAVFGGISRGGYGSGGSSGGIACIYYQVDSFATSVNSSVSNIVTDFVCNFNGYDCL